MEKLRIKDSNTAKVHRRAKSVEFAGIQGTYHVVCRDKHGKEKWRDVIRNTVVTVGKNLILDQALAGAAYTVTGPFLGLISSADFTAINAADTMASHAGWKEANSTNAPDYAEDRQTMAWDAAAAGAKALSAALTYTFTGAGTVKGAFAVLGSGASATKANTGGTLLSAGLFTGGDKVVDTDDTLDVSYELAL